MLEDDRWNVMGEPATDREAAALEQFRKTIPHDGINTAWVNLTFIDNNGRTNEIDVLLLTRTGLYLMELKGWHGTVRGTTQHWVQNRRSQENPYLSTDRKAKRLRSVLLRYAPRGNERDIPFIEACVVMHGEGSTVELEPQARAGVMTLDGYRVKSKGTLPQLSAFLGEPARNPQNQVDGRRMRSILRICEDADLQPRPKVRMVGDYKVTESTPIAEGPDWQDVRVTHPAVPKIASRVRLYDVPPKASEGERNRIELLAKREFQLTYGIRHEGIATPVDFRTTDDGPALVFEHDDDAQPLDAWIADQGADLSLDERLALIVQLGSTLSYAHRHRLIHRALAPARVWVTPRKRGLPQLTIRDWYFGQKERSTDGASRWTSISAGVSDFAAITEQQDWLYLAPETSRSIDELPGVPLDVYGFGALSHLILTGKHPAATAAELEDLRHDPGHLDPRAAAPGMPDDVAQAIAFATSTVEVDRPATIDEVLGMLQAAWGKLKRDDGVEDQTLSADPLDAQSADMIGDRFLVAERRGEGSSGVAFAVLDDDAEDHSRTVVLKVAKSDAAARRMVEEAGVLRALQHKRVVSLIEGPFDVGGRQAVLLGDAGPETLATRLAKEGRSTLGQLENLGGDLLEAVSYVDSQGVFHRDIKPANLGITPDPSTKRPSLVLFDFSLSTEPLDNTTSGTPGYTDLYLGKGRRRKYDRAAELWGVAATLFEMATGAQVWWGAGVSGPATPKDAPVVEPESFEPAVRTQLTALFKRALDPDVKKRFGSAEELYSAWTEVFASLDVGQDAAEADDDAAAAATADTPLTDAGLSARALSGVRRLDGVETVGDLLGLHPVRVNSIPGIGERYRKELQRRIREWRGRLRVVDVPAGTTPGTEQTVAALLDELSGSERTILEHLLGVATRDPTPTHWPKPSEVAQRLDIGREQVTKAASTAVTTWTRKSGTLDSVRGDILAVLARSGRVMTVPEIVAAVLAVRGSLLDGDERLRHGAALTRAAFELDVLMPDPALVLRRSHLSNRPDIIALREKADPAESGDEFPGEDQLMTLASELGHRAKEIVGRGVVPVTQAASALREVADDVLEEHSYLLTDRRLLRLAAATSERAEVSGLDELYPRDLALRTALELAVRGKPGARLSVDAIRRSVRARFGAVELPESLKDLDAIVLEVLPGAVREGDVYTMPTGTSAHTGTRTAATQFASAPVSEVGEKLADSLGRRSALTLCAPPRRYVRAGAALGEAFDVDTLDVSALVVDATREAATGHGIDWEFVLDVDARAREISDWTNLTHLVQQAIRPRWEERLAGDRPLLITNPGPLVRYGMADLLATLLDVGTHRPAARWLLVALHGDQGVPTLEGQPVPLGPSKWINLPADLSTLSSGATR